MQFLYFPHQIRAGARPRVDVASLRPGAAVGERRAAVGAQRTAAVVGAHRAAGLRGRARGADRLACGLSWNSRKLADHSEAAGQN